MLMVTAGPLTTTFQRYEYKPCATYQIYQMDRKIPRVSVLLTMVEFTEGKVIESIRKAMAKVTSL